MSIDEVISAAYLYGQSRRFESEERSDKRMSTLREAIEQHVAETVARELEGCAKMADEYATWGGSNFYDWFKKLATAIRARAEKETT